MMPDTQGAGGTNLTQQFVPGMPVFDAGGEKVGMVSDPAVQDGYLVVQKGWLFPKDVAIPLTSVTRNDADGVYLSLYKDDLQKRDWEAPTTDDAGTIAAGRATARRT